MGAPDDCSTTEKGGSGSHVPWWRQRRVLLVIMCLAAMVMVTIIVTITLTASCTCESVPETTSTPIVMYTDDSTPTSAEPEWTLADGRPIVRRSNWSDVPPLFRRPLRHPTPYVVIGHTAGPACSGMSQCVPVLRSYRDEHRVTWGQPDIVYNFVIDVAGNVYECRGWDATNNYGSWVRRCNLAVTLLGNFETEDVTAEMEQSLYQLLELGVALGKLDPLYRLVAHNQVTATLSPGRNALRVIDAWPQRCLSDCSEGVQCVVGDSDELAT